MSTLRPFPGLNALNDAWQRQAGEAIDPIDLAYQVRQINVAEGCLFACSHCFAAPAAKMRVMALAGFRQLAIEIGAAVAKRGDRLQFCYLGAETDLAVVPEAHRYLAAWLNALPAWQPVKIYSHGWILTVPGQQQALEDLLDVLAAQPKRLETFAISVDFYNLYAKRNRDAYAANLTAMLRRLLQRVPYDRLKLQVTYPVERVSVTGPSCAAYYSDRLKHGLALPSWQETQRLLAAATDPAERACAELTGLVFEAAMAADLPFDFAAAMTHDNFVPFPSGRARRFFKNRTDSERAAAYAHQQSSCLKPLQGFERQYRGFIIGAAGTVTPVENAGYRKEEPLENGRRIIPYLSAAPLQQRAWTPADLKPQPIEV